MPKKTTALVRPSGTFITSDQFSSLPWWKKFSDSDQSQIQHEVRELVKAKIANRVSAWVMGEHLLNLRSILEPQRVFVKTLRKLKLGFSWRTAYRYIDDYEEAARRLPEPILRGAIQRGLDITENMLHRLPPPPKNPEKAVAWLDLAEKTGRSMRRARFVKGSKESKNRRGIPADPRVMQIECFRFVGTRVRRLPRRMESRQKWGRELCEYLATLFGFENDCTVTPRPIPADYVAKAGRPRGSGKIKAQAPTGRGRLKEAV